MASIEYDNLSADERSRTVRINFWPNEEESLTYQLEQQDYALRSITAPDNLQVLLGYDDHPKCGWLLNAIQTFEGVKETVTYAANQITFSDKKLTALPAVSTHTLTPLGEHAVDVVTAYTYFQADKTKAENAGWSYKTKVQQGPHVMTVHYGDDYSVVKEEEEEDFCRIVTSYEMKVEEDASGYREIKKKYARLAKDKSESAKREETQRTAWSGGKIRSQVAGNKTTYYFDSCRSPANDKRVDLFEAVNRDFISQPAVATEIEEISKKMRFALGEKELIPVAFLHGLKTVLDAKCKIAEDVYTGKRSRPHITTELIQMDGSDKPFMMKCTELNFSLKPKWVALCLNHSSDGEPVWITVSHTYGEKQKDSNLGYGRLIASSQGDLTTTYDYSLTGTALTLTTNQTIGTSSRVSSETCSILSGRLIAQQDVDGNVSQYQYDTSGRLTRFIQCAQSETYRQVTTFAYPRPGRVETTEPDGQRCATEDDGQGNVLSEYVYDEPSKQWRQMLKVEYDARGRKCKTTEYDYRADGSEMSETCELAYDGWGQEFKQDFGGDRRIFNRYDPVTLTREEWSGSANNNKRKVTTYTEDGSVAKVESEDAPPQTLTYTHAFQVAKQVNQYAHELRYTYDAAGRPLTEVSGFSEIASGGVYTYEYPEDVTIREASKISLDGKVLGERTFDAWGRVTSFTRGDVTETFAYEGAASVPKSRTAAGQTLDYTYIPELGNKIHTISGNHKGQALSKTFAYLHGATKDSSAREGEQLLEFRHDLNGHPTLQRCTVDKQATAVQRSFSLAGRLLSETDPAGRSVSYSYDDRGQRTAVQIDGQTVATHSYDKGRLYAEQISHGKDNIRVRYHYDDSTHREVKRKYTLDGAFALQVNRGYGMDGRLYSIALAKPDRTVTGKSGEELGSHLYEYSASGRLTSCKSSGVWQPKTPTGKAIDKQEFTHDALGNVISCVTSFGDERCASTYTYDADKGYRLTRVEHDHADYKSKNATLTYDAAGRITKDINGKTYEYDWLGRLIRAGSRYYTYDPADQLVGSSSAAGTPAHRLVYDGFKVRGEYPVPGTTDSRYVQPGSSACQVQVNKAGSETRNLLTLCDDDGTVLVSFDLASRVVRYHAYSAYGEHHSDEKGALHGFNGEYLAADDQAYPLGHGYRWYVPQSMQFQAQDSQSPFDDGGPSAYGYCDGDPVNYKDPSGHFKLRRSHWDISASEPKPVSLGKLGGLISTILWTGIGVLTAIMTGGASLLVTGILVALAAAAAATAIAGVVIADSNPEASGILGWVSLGLTVAGGLAQLGQKAATLATRLARSGMAVARRVTNKAVQAAQHLQQRITRVIFAARSMYAAPARASVYKLGYVSESIDTLFKYRALATPTPSVFEALKAFDMGDVNTVVCAVSGVLNNAEIPEDEKLRWASVNINNATGLAWGSFTKLWRK